MRTRRAGLIFILPLLLILSLDGCTKLSRSSSGSVDIHLVLRMPDFFHTSAEARDTADQPRIVDPATKVVEVTITGPSMETVTQSFDFTGSGTWESGTGEIVCLLTDVPVGSNRVFTVLTRDAAGTGLTSGSAAMDVFMWTEKRLDVLLVPVDAEDLSVGFPVTDTIGLGRMDYYVVTLDYPRSYVVNLTSGEDADLYVYTEEGRVHTDDAWEAGAPTGETAVIDVTGETTCFIGVFGSTASSCDYTLMIPGIPDVFIANMTGGAGAINRVYLGDGSGTFPEIYDASADNNRSRAVALGDINNDGNIDAFVANEGINRVYLGDGTGAFPTVLDATSDSVQSWDVALGDLDNDGNLDAFVVNGLNDRNRVYLGNGDGTFSPGTDASLVGDPVSHGVALGYFNGDNNLDAFVANYDSTGPEENYVYIGNGDGTFSYSYAGGGTATYRDVALGDLNHDGNIDVVVSAAGNNDRIYLGDGTGTFSNFLANFVAAASDGIALGDLNGDNNLDVIEVGRITWGINRVYLGNGDGTFTAGYDIDPEDLDSLDVALADLNADGNLDAFVSNGSGSPRIYLGDGTGNFPVKIDAGSDTVVGDGVAIGELNGR